MKDQYVSQIKNKQAYCVNVITPIIKWWT